MRPRPATQRPRLRWLLCLTAELGLLAYLLPLGDGAPTAPVWPLERVRAISLGRTLRADDLPAPAGTLPVTAAVDAGPRGVPGPAREPGGPDEADPGPPPARPSYRPDLSRSPPRG
jgi:hypothetical protein